MEFFNSTKAGSLGGIPSASSRCCRVDRSRPANVGRLVSSSREFAIDRLDARLVRRVNLSIEIHNRPRTPSRGLTIHQSPKVYVNSENALAARAELQLRKARSSGQGKHVLLLIFKHKLSRIVASAAQMSINWRQFEDTKPPCRPQPSMRCHPVCCHP
jgi:hypothetical protein